MFIKEKPKNYKTILEMSNKRKTEQLIEKCYYLLEQDEDLDMELSDDTGDVTDQIGDQEERIIPLTSEGEEQYIQDLVDAALFEPSSEDSKILTDLQAKMSSKDYQNAREDILPVVLRVIRGSTEDKQIKDSLNKL